MKLAIMQPYFFPYLGYWQLMKLAQTFVVYDDVGYIKGGWIGRNRILVNGAPIFINAPLVDASSSRRICDHRLLAGTLWRTKLLRTVEMAYNRRPYFDETFALVEAVVTNYNEDLASFLLQGLQLTARHLGIETRIVASSRVYDNDDLHAQERVLDICRREAASCYVNPKGGMALYQPAAFNQRGVDLRFIDTPACEYRQGPKPFVPWLSIIDVLMCLGRDGVQPHLLDFRLLEASERHALGEAQ